jgi:crotonobetainyl-CoA:carnitine CoA-transferase CaiB-like acyl-CoA transferase
MEVSRTVAGGYCGKLLRDAGAEVVRVEEDEECSPFLRYLHEGKTPGWSAAVDVLIEDVGLGLNTVDPGVAVVSLSPFGRTGPWAGRPATEFTLQAWCGSTGSRGLRTPVCSGGRLGEYAAGAYAAIAALTARPSARVDVSMLEAMLLTQNTYGYLFPQLGAPGPPRSVELPSVEPAKDGYIGFCTVTAQQFQSFLLMIERPDWVDDAELATAAGRRRRRTEFLRAVHAWTTTRTVAEILELAEALRIPAAPVTTPASVLEVEHFRERGVFSSNRDGLPWPRVPYRPAGSAGFVDVRGVRIVDLTAFWAGPSATHLLAALGADVIKVESPSRPDPMRFTTARPGAENWWEYGPIFHGANTGKRGLALDLPAGRDLLRRLVEVSDVLVENFTPRVLEQLDLSPDRLLAWNPDLIVVRMPAFGLDGPWRDKPGFAQTMEQVSSLAWITGEADLPPMTPKAGDPIAGLHAAFATLVALNGPRGVVVEAPMIEAILNVAAEAIIDTAATGVVRSRTGNHDPKALLQGVYPCAGADQWLALNVETEQQLVRLTHLLGADIAGHLRRRDRDATVELLLAHGIPAAPVLTPAEAARNPQLEHRRFLERLTHPIAGSLDLPGLPYPRDRPWLRWPAPTLGQHNAEILSGLLGISGQDLAELRVQGIIGESPRR